MDKYMIQEKRLMTSKTTKKDKEKPKSGNDKMADPPSGWSPSDLSPGAIQQLTAAVVAALEPRFETLTAQFNTMQAHHTSLTDRTSELEQRVALGEDLIQTHEDTLKSLQMKLSTVETKLEDLENRSCDNLRFLGFPETLPERDLISLLEDWLASVLPLAGGARVTLDRAHRVGREREGATRSRLIIAKVHSFARKTELLTLYRKQRDRLSYEEHKILIFQDYSASLMEKRQSFQPLCTVLADRKQRFLFLYPAILKIQHQGRWITFDSLQKASDFINTPP